MDGQEHGYRDKSDFNGEAFMLAKLSLGTKVMTSRFNCPWRRTPIQFIARIGLASLIAPYPMLMLVYNSAYQIYCCEAFVGMKSTKCTEKHHVIISPLFCTRC